jgi:3-oxoadipate enol-lactonase
MPTFQVPGAKLEYRIDDFTDAWRPSETVFLHHAAISQIDRWRAWVPTLARHYKVIRMDMRGHGESTVPPHDYEWSMERLSTDVAELLEHLDTGPVHFVGVSAGGIIGIDFAHRYSDLVKSLTLVAATPRLADTRVDFSHWLRLIRDVGVREFLLREAGDRFSADADPRLIEWFADIGGTTPASVVSTFVPWLATVDLSDKLPEIAVPTLIIASEDDVITPMAAQRTLVELLPDARLVTYATDAHNIADQMPDRCATDTLDFLQEIDSRFAGPRARPDEARPLRT